MTDALQAFAESLKGMSKKEQQAHKKWFTRKIQEQHAHESQLAIIKLFTENDEMPYYAGVMLGSVAAVVGVMSSGVMPTGDERDPSKAAQGMPAPVEGGTTDPKLLCRQLGAGWTPSPDAPRECIYIQSYKGDSVLASFIPGADLLASVNNVLAMGGVGFAGFCGMILILKALFGTGGMGEVLKGIGEITPG